LKFKKEVIFEGFLVARSEKNKIEGENRQIHMFGFHSS